MTDKNNITTRAHALAGVVYLSELARVCGGERGTRMRAARDQRLELLTEAGQIDGPVDKALRAACEELNEVTRVSILAGLIDDSNPFRPNQISFDGDERLAAISGTATIMGIRGDTAQRVHAAWENVDGLHIGVSAGEIVALGLMAGAAIFVPVAAGPAVAGLAGAAAITAGLAGIGAAVGGGMAAGTIVLAVGGAVVAASATHLASSILKEASAGQLAADVRQTQIVVATLYSTHGYLVREAREGLRAVQSELETRLADTLKTNDDDSAPVEAIRSALGVTEVALEWLENPNSWGAGAYVGKKKRELRETLDKARRWWKED